MLVLMVGVGAGNTSFNTTSNALVLLTTEPHMRGRVLSVRALVSQGSTPAGSLVIGWVCEVAGPRTGMAVGGIFALAACLVTLSARSTARHWHTGPTSVDQMDAPRSQHTAATAGVVKEELTEGGDGA